MRSQHRKSVTTAVCESDYAADSRDNDKPPLRRGYEGTLGWALIKENRGHFVFQAVSNAAVPLKPRLGFWPLTPGRAPRRSRVCVR